MKIQKIKFGGGGGSGWWGGGGGVRVNVNEELKFLGKWGVVGGRVVGGGGWSGTGWGQGGCE